MKPTILIDMDDTMEELLPSWVNYLNGEYLLHVDPKDITDWDIKKFFPTLTREQVFAPLNTDSFWETVQPKKDAVEYIKKLSDEGYDIFVCTASNYKTLRTKMERLLFRYFDFLDWDNVIVTPYKQLIMADFLVDDNPANLLNGCYRGILMDAPHNQWFDNVKSHIPRVKCWSEAYQFIKNNTES